MNQDVSAPVFTVDNKYLYKKPSGPLYHYTNQKGLIGIICKKEIWASHTQYLNDQSELKHALDLFADCIKRRKNSIDKDPKYADIKGLAEAIKSLLTRIDRSIHGLENANTFVSSFSELQDSLSQWRAYGGSSSGFAIGFDGEFLMEVAHCHQHYLEKCVYREHDQIDLIEDSIDATLGLILGDTPPTKHLIDTSIGALVHYIRHCAPMLKHDAFVRESEWRIIVCPPEVHSENIRHRHGSSMLIPYCPVKLVNKKGEFRVKEVVVGPTPYMEQSKRSIESFLAGHGLKDVPVGGSNVPYRAKV